MMSDFSKFFDSDESRSNVRPEAVINDPTMDSAAAKRHASQHLGRTQLQRYSSAAASLHAILPNTLSSVSRSMQPPIYVAALDALLRATQADDALWVSRILSKCAYAMTGIGDKAMIHTVIISSLNTEREIRRGDLEMYRRQGTASKDITPTLEIGSKSVTGKEMVMTRLLNEHQHTDVDVKDVGPDKTYSYAARLPPIMTVESERARLSALPDDPQQRTRALDLLEHFERFYPTDTSKYNSTVTLLSAIGTNLDISRMGSAPTSAWRAAQPDPVTTRRWSPKLMAQPRIRDLP
jgi:hypothetical protein